MKVKVGVSNHHVHLTKEDLDILFGKDYKLNIKFNLNQPNQFASLETVTIKTDKSEISNVRILGPVREYTQVEIGNKEISKDKITSPLKPIIRKATPKDKKHTPHAFAQSDRWSVLSHHLSP